MKRTAWLVAASVVGTVVAGYLCTKRHRRLKAEMAARELVRYHRQSGGLKEGIWILGPVPEILGWHLPALEAFAQEADRLLQPHRLKASLYHDESSIHLQVEAVP